MLHTDDDRDLKNHIKASLSIHAIFKKGNLHTKLLEKYNTLQTNEELEFSIKRNLQVFTSKIVSSVNT